MTRAINKVIGVLMFKLAAYTAYVGAVVVPGVGHGQVPTLEDQVKATYLYNFIQFVEWPKDVWAHGSEFQLCVLGGDRLGGVLDAFAGERVDGRTIQVRRLATPAEAAVTRCKLVFVGRGAGDSAALLQQLPARGVLTVGETPNFTHAGGMINLYEVRGRVHFSINDRAARRAGLIVSSRLLQLARERS